MKKLLITALLAASAASNLAHAEEREWAPYKKLVDTMRLDKYYALPAAERDKLDYYVALKPANKALKATDFNLTVVHAGGRSPLAVSPDGRLRVALNPKWLAEDAKIVTSQPAGEKVGLAQGMDAIVPEGQQWQYNTLMDSVPQSNNVIGKLAGMARVFFPTVKSVRLKFDQPAHPGPHQEVHQERPHRHGRHRVDLSRVRALCAACARRHRSAHQRRAGLQRRR